MCLWIIRGEGDGGLVRYLCLGFNRVSDGSYGVVALYFLMRAPLRFAYAIQFFAFLVFLPSRFFVVVLHCR